ncbi:phage minor head protein [Pseudomonas resinovorans]|uniref:Phage minor head protein n=1 Tax=Metapseudomonas resinovorans TaxID=53412 RepID=A0ABT4Y423_METRE|nr:phage minor head protein [Pseudomonas resinovorans]MDA8483601.1 phage minor head protein [Pseudomonas resinovorans]
MIELKPLPPAEAIEYFEQKGYAISFDYRDVWQAQHQAAFTVAKVMQQDILVDIRKAVDKALAEGIPYEQFAKALIPTLQDKGWWGRRPEKDPLTGEVREVQLGSPRRLKVIYDTNLRTAHAEGQWQRIQENKEAFPYLQYDGKNSENPRLQHAAWDSLVLPVDHPFWQEHFPVRAYGCKCRARSLTAIQVEGTGLQVGPAPEVPKVTYVNQRTGEVQQIPEGVHPSFHYPPGGWRTGLSNHLVEKLEATTEALARTSIADLVKGQAFAEWYLQPTGNFAVAYLGKQAAAELSAKTQLVVFSEATLAKQLNNQPEITLDEYAKVQEAIDAGQHAQGNTPNTRVYALEESDGYVVVVEVMQVGVEIHMTSLRRLSEEQAKHDEEVLRLLKNQ